MNIEPGCDILVGIMRLEQAMNINPHLVQANERCWQACHIRPAFEHVFASVAQRLVAAKLKYLGVENGTDVPWYVVAVIHERESSQSWTASLAQGDPWNRVSIHVPRGRGPFRSWAAAAIDALNSCPPYLHKWPDWKSSGGILTALEEYNGLGYYLHNLPSPYLWAGTDQYTSGKYIADGHFDPHAIDHQLGCAGLLKAMQAIDASVMEGVA